MTRKTLRRARGARAGAMEEEVMVAHTAFAGELRKNLAVRPELKTSLSLPRDENVTERLLSACADLAHANTLVAHAASDVLDAFFELSQARCASLITIAEDEHVETVVDALVDVARGVEVSIVSSGRVTNKRARVARTLEDRRVRGAARAANALRLALKRESREHGRNTSRGPRLGRSTNAAARDARKGKKTRRSSRTSAVFDGVAGRLRDVALAAASSAPVGATDADADGAFLWKTSTLRLVVQTSRALDARDEANARNDAETDAEPRRRSTARSARSARSERLARAATESSAALDLMTQAFLLDGGRRPPPAYYAHAAFAACERLYARKGKCAPKAFVRAAIQSGALAWPSARAPSETLSDDGPFPVTFADVASPDGTYVSTVSTQSKPDLPRHNTSAVYRRAWLMAFHSAWRGPEFEAAAKEGSDGFFANVAWPSPSGVDGAETPARRLARVFLDDDDALWDFMDCVLKAAEWELEEEEEEEDEDAAPGVARRLGWNSERGDGPTPSEVFLALLELLGWDVDALEATLSEDAAATVLGYLGRARQFAHEWAARDAEKLLRFCEAFASKLDARVRRTRLEKKSAGRFQKEVARAADRAARNPEGFRAADLRVSRFAAFALDPLRAAIAAARERLEG